MLKTPIQRFCKKCGKPLKLRRENGRVNKSLGCSTSCNTRIDNLPDRTCPICNKPLNKRKSNGRINRRKFCSVKCQHIALRKFRYCKVCGKEIPRLTRNGKKSGATIYCSRNCYSKDRWHPSDETKRKLRIATINYYNSIGGVSPIFNIEACKFFDEFDSVYNTKGQYATKGGEYLVKDQGYFLDYINFDLKIIIEWNERHHYRKGKLCDRDLRRQKEIEAIFSNFKFVQLPAFDIATQQLLVSGSYFKLPVSDSSH